VTRRRTKIEVPFFHCPSAVGSRATLGKSSGKPNVPSPALRMSSIPVPPDSTVPIVDWRALRASIERGMLRERGSLRGRMKRLEDASRGGKDISAEIGKLLIDAQQSESQVAAAPGPTAASRVPGGVCRSVPCASRSPKRFAPTKW